VYEFTPPDAGTFWYHPHTHTLQQLGRGLAGALIVEEPEPVAVDRDLLWFIQDWRLDDDGRIVPGFGNRMEAGMSGRIGNTVTLNGRVPGRVSIKRGSGSGSESSMRHSPGSLRFISRATIRWWSPMTASRAIRIRPKAVGWCLGRQCAPTSSSIWRESQDRATAA